MSLIKKHTFKIGDREYKNATYVARGGSGEVYKATSGERTVALKAFFPFHQRRQLDTLGELGTTQVGSLVKESLDFQQREFAFITRITHPNIVRALDVGTYRFTATERKSVERDLAFVGIEEVPVLVSDFVDGCPIDEAIDRFALSPDELAYALTRVAEALDYLHAHHQYLHTDVKASNVLVREDIREPVLIDFALSKNFNFGEIDPTKDTKLLGDWDLLPRTLNENHPLSRAKVEGLGREQLKAEAFPALDLYDFGLLLERLNEACSRVFEEREMRYLAVLIYELKQWDSVRRWEPGELARRVGRLRPGESTPFGVAELAAPGVPEHTVVVPEAKAVPLTRAVKPLLATASFARLGTVNQLSLVEVIYPGADYKRRVHVLYAYELARQLVSHLYSSARFRYLFDERSVQQLLIATLLHDINHFPFLHTLQESGLPSVDRLELFDLVCNGELTEDDPSIYDILDGHGLDRMRFKRLLQGSFSDQRSEVDQVISSIINSGVDVDKLSYLRLDAHFSGVPYGKAIDITTLLKAATVAPIESGFHLAFEERALSALEHAVFTRYWNFRTIYWHHTNRALMAMVLAVFRAVYGTRPVEEYLRATAFAGEWGAIRHLDSQYEAARGRASILRGLERDRSIIYKRIYTVHPATDDADRELYGRLRTLDTQGEEGFRMRLAAGFTSMIGTGGRNVTIDDVLVDVPRRDLDLGGSVWVLAAGPQKLMQLSKPVDFLAGNYTQLSQRARIFAAPWVREALKPTAKTPDRAEMRRLIAEALKEGAGPSEVR